MKYKAKIELGDRTVEKIYEPYLGVIAEVIDDIYMDFPASDIVGISIQQIKEDFDPDQLSIDEIRGNK